MGKERKLAHLDAIVASKTNEQAHSTAKQTTMPKLECALSMASCTHQRQTASSKSDIHQANSMLHDVHK
jgi:hypothetical protein